MNATTTSFTKKFEKEQPVFLYGSHYSTPAFISFYLLRAQPEWQLCLQNGRFDHPNRLFHSIADTWKNCLNIDSDVKELVK
jgi:factor associated with neutral sphingomyelinase activation